MRKKNLIDIILATLLVISIAAYPRFLIAETNRPQQKQNPRESTQNVQKAEEKKTFSYRVIKRFRLNSLAKLDTLQFKFPLVRKDIPHQTISDIHISPNPNAVIHDPDGNEIAIFYFVNIKGGENIYVQIDYKVEFEQLNSELDSASIPDDYANLSLELTKFLEADEDIDVNDKLFQEKLQGIIGNTKNPYLKGKAIYDFIVNNIKYENREHLSGLQKPIETLGMKRGNCADIAKLFIAFSRSCGIPARQVDGLIFKPNISDNKSVLKEGHAWVEIYLPSYGWVPVDPTFGILEKEKYFAFQYKRHIREFYGKIYSRDRGSLFTGSAIEVRGNYNLGRVPVQESVEIEVELLNPEKIVE